MIILDTNVVSEIMKPRPAVSVEKWVAAYPFEELFITAITQAEILYGLELLPVGRRAALQLAARGIVEEGFAGRILPFDVEAARAFARIRVERRARGRPVAALDAQIAAIAVSHGAALATRNTPDFEGCGIQLMNPWSTVRTPH
jgi:predicted nucleic acid-binding protein